MWTDFAGFQASLRRALAYDFEHAASCHGSVRCIDGGAKTTLAREFDWLLSLRTLEAIGLVANYVRRPPGMFFRLGKEMLAERRARD